MRDIFKGFLLLRFVGFLALVILLAVVLGVRSLARGSDVLGLALLVGALLLAAATASLVSHSRRSRPPR